MIWMLLLWNQKQQSPPAPETADARATDDKPLYSDFLLPPSVFFFLLSSERGKKKEEAEETKCSAASERLDRCRVVSVRVRACVRACVSKGNARLLLLLLQWRPLFVDNSFKGFVSGSFSLSLSLSLSLMKRSSAVSSAVSSHFFLLFFLFFLSIRMRSNQ